MENNMICVTQKDFDAVLEKTAEKAAEKVLKLQEQNHNKRSDKKIHNVKLLLQNYKLLKQSTANAFYEKTENITLREILEEIMCDSTHIFSTVESIKTSVTKTEIMLEHIDNMLNIYKSICENSSNENSKRGYFVIYNRYINNDSMKIEDIAKHFRITKSMVYKISDNACKALAMLIFGVDSIKF